MMRCDAEWLGRELQKRTDAELSPLLNLGASTKRFREVEQPHIHELVFAPLQARGIPVVHTDLKEADGVDIAGDVFDDAVLAQMKALAPRAVVCTHMFEHVIDREALSRRLLELLPAGGLFFVTVPSSYHEHHDPIDTMYRPTPDQLAVLFREHAIIQKNELTGHTYWAHVRRRPFTIFFRHFTRFFVPFLGWRQWKRSMSKLYWLFYPYKVAAIVGQKVPAP